MGAPVSAFSIQVATPPAPVVAGSIPCGLPGGQCGPVSAMGRATVTPAMGRGSLLARVATTSTAPILVSSRASTTPVATAPDVSSFTPGRSGFGGALGGGASLSAPNPGTAPSPAARPALPPVEIQIPSGPSTVDPTAPPPALAADRAVASGERADESEFAVKVPTWLLAGVGVAVVALGAFALHRVLPAKHARR